MTSCIGLSRRIMVIAGMSIGCTLLSAQPAAAQSRSIQRGASRALNMRLRKLLMRDRIRDSKLPLRTLSSPRTVYRYVRPERAAFEIRKGLPAGAHVTSTARPGRPMSSAAAIKRYGLPAQAGDRLIRETIQLTRGLRVRFGKALGGVGGFGELKVLRKIPPAAISRRVRLP
jgi:hypothetical protein